MTLRELFCAGKPSARLTVDNLTITVEYKHGVYRATTDQGDESNDCVYLDQIENALSVWTTGEYRYHRREWE